MNTLQLLLASGSPRRRELLTLIGLPFAVARPDIDETPTAGEPADQYVMRLSREKSLAIASSDGLIVTADTTVAAPSDNPIDKSEAAEIIGKPADAQEATAILQRLRGRAHMVYTGVTLRHVDSSTTISSTTTLTSTQVIMRDYSDAEIAQYVASGEPFDKAGSYGIQSAIFRSVLRIEGCYANVMGLPLCTLCHMLTAQGVTVPQPVACDPAHNQCIAGSA